MKNFSGQPKLLAHATSVISVFRLDNFAKKEKKSYFFVTSKQD